MSALARCIVVLLIGVCGAGLFAQNGAKKKADRRYGIDFNDSTYPQQTPADAMKSIIVALDRKNVDYLLAHLADPAFVDYWVDRYKTDFPKGKEEAKRLLAFDRLAGETRDYFLNDPLIVKDLRVFAKKAEWKEEDGVATGSVESIPGRKVFLKKIGDRWFLENRQE